ncbi:MAG: hypothetical protein M1546_07955 [Chloroflexi bacterium]|nr:hypothetical protein [Chloroflexota bacterium]
MVRLIVFALIVFVFGFGAFRLSERMGIAFDARSYIAGLVVATLIGYASFRIINWWGMATRPFQPQTVTLRTTETPSKITIAAVVGFALFIVVIGGLLYIAVHLVNGDF